MTSLWSVVLIASVAIGVFLLSVLLGGRKSNPQATYLFSSLILLLIATNIDNWFFASGLWREFPMIVGFSRGSILLIGPIIYCYSRSIMTPDFRFTRKHLLHFAPYAIAYAYMIPQLYIYGAEYKRLYFGAGMEYDAPIPDLLRVILGGYAVHITVYLGLTVGLIRSSVRNGIKTTFIVPIEERMKWIRQLAIAFIAGFSALLIPLVWAVMIGVYQPGINYTGTVIYSLLIYFIGVKIVRNEYLVLPGFARKYQSLQLSQEQKNEALERLRQLVIDNKLYLDPDLTLGKAAEALALPPGYLSRLINEEYGKSFPDFINSHRVEEFKRLANEPSYASHSIYGLALEVGFNSKSSFNSAFRKLTGKTPSDFKKS